MQKTLLAFVDDLYKDPENAGALWIDTPVVIDGHLISARTPKDLPTFAKAMVEVLNHRQPNVAQVAAAPAS